MAGTTATPHPAAAPARDLDLPADRRRPGLLFFAALAIALVYPILDRALGFNRIGSFLAIAVFVVLAIGLNVVVGYAGLLDLGYAAFFAIGAYTIGLLTSPSSVFVQNGWVPGWLQNFWPAMAISWVVAAIFGVLLGAPTLRLRGDYLAIVTLGFGEIVPTFFLNADAITGGTMGINPIAKPPSFSILGHTVSFGQTDQQNWYYLMLGVILVSLFLSLRLYNSRLGRAWQAVREDEIAAASMGVNLVRTKLWAFALGASFSGFAGSIYSAAFQYVHPSQFEFVVSIMILAMVILGGIGNVYGVIVGAILIGSFDRILTDALADPVHRFGQLIGSEVVANHNLANDRYVVFGLALVVMMLLRPGGLFPSAQRRAEMTPESEDVRVHETQTLYDIRAENEPAVGERA